MLFFVLFYFLLLVMMMVHSDVFIVIVIAVVAAACACMRVYMCFLFQSYKMNLSHLLIEFKNLAYKSLHQI
jgi:hypothetical protein